MAGRVGRSFIDSRYKTNASASDIDFRIDLAFPVEVEAGSHIRVDSLLLSHVRPTVALGVNDTLYLREVADDNTSYHQLLTLPAGTYSIGKLGVALQEQLRADSRITDGTWTVATRDGQLSLHQSPPTATAILYCRADLRSERSIPINWTFTTGTVAASSDWPTIWSAANIRPGLPRESQDGYEMIALMYRRLKFSPSAPLQQTDHIDLARYKTLHLCSRDLPQTSLTAHGRCNVIKSLICASSAPGSIVHDVIPSNSSIYCPTSFQLRHMAFQLRGFDDKLVQLYGHQLSFVLEIIRPYEQ